MREPNDYGEELEQQAARKAAKEYEWSGRHLESKRRASAIVNSVLAGVGYGLSSDELIGMVEKLLTSPDPPV